MKTEIGAYEAETRLLESLRRVQTGKRFTITNRGKAIADLIPGQLRKPKDPAAVIERFLSFKQDNPIRQAIDIKALIDEGRE